jgi:hypothetical protein
MNTGDLPMLGAPVVRTLNATAMQIAGLGALRLGSGGLAEHIEH